jgi:hypothetical protein
MCQCRRDCMYFWVFTWYHELRGQVWWRQSICWSRQCDLEIWRSAFQVSFTRSLLQSLLGLFYFTRSLLIYQVSFEIWRSAFQVSFTRSLLLGLFYIKVKEIYWVSVYKGTCTILALRHSGIFFRSLLPVFYASFALLFKSLSILTFENVLNLAPTRGVAQFRIFSKLPLSARVLLVLFLHCFHFVCLLSIIIKRPLSAPFVVGTKRTLYIYI